MRHLILPLLCAVFIAGGAGAQTSKISVYVSHNGDDAVGMQLAYRFREELARSARFTNALNADSSLFVIHLITINPEADQSKSNFTAYSYSLTIRNDKGWDYFITSLVGTCGSLKVSSCAVSLVANVDRQTQKIQELLKSE